MASIEVLAFLAQKYLKLNRVFPSETYSPERSLTFRTKREFVDTPTFDTTHSLLTRVSDRGNAIASNDIWQQIVLFTWLCKIPHIWHHSCLGWSAHCEPLSRLWHHKIYQILQCSKFSKSIPASPSKPHHRALPCMLWPAALPHQCAEIWSISNFKRNWWTLIWQRDLKEVSASPWVSAYVRLSWVAISLFPVSSIISICFSIDFAQ